MRRYCSDTQSSKIENAQKHPSIIHRSSPHINLTLNDSDSSTPTTDWFAIWITVLLRESAGYSDLCGEVLCAPILCSFGWGPF